MFKFNINHKIKVKLTDKGKEILNKWIAKVNKMCGIESDFIPSCYQEDEDGYIHPQLWEFMNIFGPYFAFGSPCYIEHNTIIFDEEGFEDVRKERPQGDCKSCDFRKFSETFIDGVVDVMNKNGITSVEQLSELLKIESEEENENFN